MSDMSEILDALKTTQASFDKASHDFTVKAEQAVKEAKASGEISAATKEAVDKVATDHNSLLLSVTELKAQLSEVENCVNALPNGGASAGAKPLSPGHQVIAFEDLVPFARRIQANERGRLSIPVRNATLTADIATGIIEPTRIAEIDVLPKRRLFIRDLIAGGRTTSNAIFWVRMTGFTNAAATVAENTAKPYSDIDYETELTPVRTIAHLFKASKQVLDDFPQLQSQIDAEMRFGLRMVEETEILFGDGTGTHLHGIVPQSTAYSSTGIPADPTRLDALRWAMLQAQLARIPATGHVLHFADWAKIELQKDDVGRYIIGDPQGVAAPRLWGLPVVTTELSALAGKFVTGSFAYGAQLFDREDANVVISTENVDDFEKNMVTVRCEERIGLAVKRPEAFIYGTLPVPA